MRPRVLFDHLPKCAGTSVQSLLTRIYGADRVAPFISSHSVEACLRLYTRYDAVAGHFCGRILLDTPFPLSVITVVRDPVERVLSFFHYQRSQALGLGGGATAADALAEMDLDAFIRSRDVLAGSIPNWFCHHFASAIGPVTRPQDLLVQAVRALDYYDLVGVCEEMDETTRRIAVLCGGEEGVAIGRDNVTADRPLRGEIEPSTLKLIESANLLDLEFYKRAVDRFHEPREPRARAELAPPSDVLEFGSREINFEKVWAKGRRSDGHMAAAGDTFDVHFTLASEIDETDLGVIVMLKNQLGDLVFGWDSKGAGERISVEAGERRDFTLSMPLNLGFGPYTVVLVSYPGRRPTEQSHYHWLEPAALIDVQSNTGGHFFGATKMEAQLSERVVELRKDRAA